MTGEPAPLRRHDLALFAVGALVLVAMSSMMALRLGYAPDEASHRHIVGVLAEQHRPANWQDTRYGVERGHAYHLYSPVAYLPYVPAHWASEVIGPIERAERPDALIVRFGAWPIAVAQLAATWCLVRRLWRGSSARAALALSFALNLVPQLRYMHAYVTTDGMTVLAATVAAAVTVRILTRERIGLVDGVVAGLAVALCAHVRYNALIVAALVVVAMFWRTIRHPTTDWRERLRPLTVAIALALVLAAPFHLWVYQEQANRHWTASTSHEQLRESTFSGTFTPDVTKRELLRTRLDEVDSVGQGIWLRFQRYHELSVTNWRILSAIVVLGAVIAMTRRRSPAVTKTMAIGLSLAFAATWVAMAMQWPFTAHGRFLLPAGLPLMAVGAVGLAAAATENSKINAYVIPTVITVGLGSLWLEGLGALARS